MSCKQEAVEDWDVLEGKTRIIQASTWLSQIECKCRECLQSQCSKQGFYSLFQLNQYTNQFTWCPHYFGLLTFPVFLACDLGRMSQQGNDDLELAWLVSVSSQKAQFLLYHQHSDRLHYYCSGHLRLHSKIICHCSGKEKLSSLCQLLLCFSTHYGFSTPYTWCNSCGLKFTGAFPSPCVI